MIKGLIKRILSRIDNYFNTSWYERTTQGVEKWYNSNFVNLSRRIIHPAIVRWKYKLGVKDKALLKLHLGCGNQHIDNYVNLDSRKTRAVDLVCNIKQLPYLDNSAEVIETYHVIEHLPRHEVPRALNEWYRVLSHGGRLIIECPDVDELMRRYLEGDEKQLDGIFGLQRFEGDYHLFGYNFKKLKTALEECGFTNIEDKPPQDYHTKEWSCIRAECLKE